MKASQLLTLTRHCRVGAIAALFVGPVLPPVTSGAASVAFVTSSPTQCAHLQGASCRPSTLLFPNFRCKSTEVLAENASNLLFGITMPQHVLAHLYKLLRLHEIRFGERFAVIVRP
jgi:hypothetical protein